MIAPDPRLQVHIGEQGPQSPVRTPHPVSPKPLRKRVNHAESSRAIDFFNSLLGPAAAMGARLQEVCERPLCLESRQLK
jgi:hypothetical protein